LVLEKLKANKEDVDVGGHEYLGELWESAQTGANVAYHAKIISDAATVRSLIHAANGIARDAHDRIAPAEELLSQAEQRILEIREDKSFSEPADAAQMVREGLRRIDGRCAREGPDGLLTGSRMSMRFSTG
jgi:replicative DNA helicase